MNVRKFLVLFTIVTLLTILISSVSFAATKSSKKAKKATTATVEVWAESGEAKVEEAKPEAKAEEVSSGEVKATSGETKTEEDTKEAELISGDAKTEEAKPEVIAEEPVLVSGDKEEVSGEEKVEEKVEEASGDKVEPTSGDVEEIKIEDVKEDDWYKPYVETVVEKGIMKVDENNNFNPKDAVTTKETLDAISVAKEVTYTINNKAAEEYLKQDITREETAHVVYQYAKSAGKGFTGSWAFLLEYKDRDAIDKDAYEAVCWCTMNKILVGRDDNTFDPKATTTRAELATIITRMIDNV